MYFTDRSPLFLLLVKVYLVVGQSSDSDPTVPPTSDLLSKLVEMKHRALDWLESQRKEDFGWGSDTSRVILSLSVSVDDWPQKGDLEAMLIAKQLEIELLAKLLRYPEDPIPPARVAYYALALNGICRDPRDYFGYNLVEILEKHTSDFEYPGYPETFGLSLASLVSCLGGNHIHRRQMHHLMQISRDDTRLHSLETRGMALMAVKCVYQHRQIETFHRVLHEGYEALGGLQGVDGSFGNIHNTALVIQGLGQDENFGAYWNETNGILGLALRQNEDGSFEDNVVGTADALLAISTLLNGSGLLKLKRHQCSTYSYKPLDSILSSSGLNDKESHRMSTIGSRPDASNTSETPISTEVTVSEGPTPKSYSSVTETPLLEFSSEKTTLSLSTMSHMTSPTDRPSSSLTLSVKYSLWIGPDPPTADKHNITITISANTTFFHVMQRAAELDPAFEFSSTVWPNGHYVHTISGHREQPVGYNYWLLYRLPTDPDPANPPPTTYVAEKGVDDLLVQDGDVYLFWFKKI